MLKIETSKGFKGCISEVKYLPVGLFFDCRSALFDVASNNRIRVHYSPFTQNLPLSGKVIKELEKGVNRRSRAKLLITMVREEWE